MHGGANLRVPWDAVVNSCTERDMLSGSSRVCLADVHRSGCVAFGAPLANHDVMGATSDAVGCSGHDSAKLSLISTAACSHTLKTFYTFL